MSGNDRSRESGRSTISIALCAFEGERYIAEQLESVAAQSRLPDELVLCDDRSSDRSVEIARGFAARAPFPVRVEPNAERLGVVKNFERAVSLCRGDIIVPCAQDDVWMPQKLALIERAFSAAPDVGLVFSDAEVVDESLQPLGYRLWESIRFGKREQDLVAAGRAFELLLKRTVVCGAAAAFRAAHRDTILPIPEAWYEDSWLAFIISARARLLALPEALMKYRQHAANQVGARKRGVLEQAARSFEKGAAAYELAAGQFEAARERLSSRPDAVRGEDRARLLSLLDAKIAHMHRRARMPERRMLRLRILVEELCAHRYHRYSNGMKSFWRDLFA